MRKKSENLIVKGKKRHHSKKLPNMTEEEFKHYNGDGIRGCACVRNWWWEFTCQGSNCKNPGQKCWGTGCVEKGDKEKHRLYY